MGLLLLHHALSLVLVHVGRSRGLRLSRRGGMALLLCMVGRLRLVLRVRLMLLLLMRWLSTILLCPLLHRREALASRRLVMAVLLLLLLSLLRLLMLSVPIPTRLAERPA